MSSKKTTGDINSKSANNQTPMLANSNSAEQLFDDDDVARFDAETYKIKYGDRWKRLASSVRDIVQSDGTVIREYVIEDPAMLEQLSDDDTTTSTNTTTTNTTVTDDRRRPTHENKKPTSSANYYYDANQESAKRSPWRANENRYEGEANLYEPSSSVKNVVDKVSASPNAIKKSNSRDSNLNTNSERPSVVKPSSHHSNSNYSNNHQMYYEQETIYSHKKAYKDDSYEDEDKEVEIIHEQGKKLKKYEEQMYKSGTGDNKGEEVPQVEYEIIDENGNQIMINGAEQLKQLAACVKEVKQADGSVVKEYILNDPKVLENIRTQMRCDGGSQSNLIDTSKKPAKLSPNPHHQPKLQNISPVENRENHKSPANKTSSVYHFQEMNEMKNRQVKAGRTAEPINRQSHLCPSPLPSLASSSVTTSYNHQPPPAPPLPSSHRVNNHPIKGTHVQLPSQLPTPPTTQQTSTTAFNSPSTKSSVKFESKLTSREENEDKQACLKQLNRNTFEFMTKKGKILQFKITNSDLNEMDVEELKLVFSTYSKTRNVEQEEHNYENIVTPTASQIEQQDQHNIISRSLSPSAASTKPPAIPTSPPRAVADPFKKSSLSSKSKSNFGEQGVNHHQLPKSGSTSNLLDDKPNVEFDACSYANSRTNRAGGIASATQAKLYEQNGPKTQNNSRPVYFSFLKNASKSPVAVPLNTNLSKAKSSNDLTEQSPPEHKLPARNNFNSHSRNNISKIVTNEFVQELNKTIGKSLESSGRNLNLATYTKSSFNARPSQEAANSSPAAKENLKRPTPNFSKSNENLSQAKSEKANVEITSEMTEQLLLKLLIQQIQIEKRERDDPNDNKHYSRTNNYPCGTNSPPKNYTYEVSRNSGSSSHFNKLKGNLVHKSMYNFSREEDPSDQYHHRENIHDNDYVDDEYARSDSKNNLMRNLCAQAKLSRRYY